MKHYFQLSFFVLLLLGLFPGSYRMQAANEVYDARTEEMIPGSFSSLHGNTVFICYYADVTLFDSAVYYPAQGGCGGRHLMKVLRYGYDSNDNPYIIDTLRLNRPEDNFDSWLMGYNLHTDSAGTFSLRTFVRDENCMDDWVPNDGEFKYTVLPKLHAGVIPDWHDTMYIKNGQVTVNIEAIAPASGGSGMYHYKWKKFENDIPRATSENLVNHILKADEFTLPKTIKFKRWARDVSKCGNAQSEGIYKLTVFDEFNPGAIDEKPDLVFCTVERARTYTVTATPATGGSKNYLYQWFILTGTGLTPVEGATDCDLPLSKVNMVEGAEYTFVRKAKDDTRFTDWTLADKQQTVSMVAQPEAEIPESEACACNGEITLYYKLLKGDVDMYSIEFSPKLAAVIGKPGIIDYIADSKIPSTIIIPDIPVLPDDEYYMNVRLGISCNAKSLEEVDCYSQVMKVSVVNGLDGYMAPKFNRMLVVDNQPDENYPLSFKDYRWYKNGQPVGSNLQYYHEADGSLLNGSYFVRLAGVDGISYRSCSIHLLAPESDSDNLQAGERIIYPAPAKAGQTVTIHSGQAVMTIYSCTGELVQTTTIGNGQSSFAAPAASGLYYIQLRYADGELLTEKLIVK